MHNVLIRDLILHHNVNKVCNYEIIQQLQIKGHMFMWMPDLANVFAWHVPFSWRDHPPHTTPKIKDVYPTCIFFQNSEWTHILEGAFYSRYLEEDASENISGKYPNYSYANFVCFKHNILSHW